MSSIGREAIVSSLLSRTLEAQDPALSAVGAKARLDYIGEFLDNFRTQWNLVNAANLIVQPGGKAYTATTFAEV